MNKIDSIAAIALGIFLVTVVVKGNAGKAIELAQRDKAFAKWALALLVLLWLYQVPEIKGPISMLIGMTFLSLFLNKIGPIKSNATKFWNSLG